MKSQTVPNKRIQRGFTLVEIVAGMVIAVILGAYAVPRMMDSSDFTAKVSADRMLAALHYAQTLAQRQGVATSAVVTTLPNRLTVNQGSPVSFPIQNYDGTDTGGIYNALLHPEVAVSSINVAYGPDGIPTSGVGTYGAKGSDGTRFTIKVEPTGFSHFE